MSLPLLAAAFQVLLSLSTLAMRLAPLSAACTITHFFFPLLIVEDYLA
jgi:hypothetical protein